MNNLQMALRIKAERKQYEAAEVLHNRELHQRILEAWHRDSPQMAARLERQGILDDLAFVSQERMWQAAAQYRKGGMPVTDAREQAERDHLMLEPEKAEPTEARMPQEAEAATLPPAR